MAQRRVQGLRGRAERVHVAVLEARHDGAAVGVDDDGTGADAPAYVRVAPDLEDLSVAADGHRLRSLATVGCDEHSSVQDHGGHPHRLPTGRGLCGRTGSGHREGACPGCGQKRPPVERAARGCRRGAVEDIWHLMNSSPGGWSGRRRPAR
ncbi:hypothetical protein ACFY1U_36555 [Streptomyces sp. NPDC001351]|uniref:hypothetical protein n=1 Tax=Streptomyces sp. NPDC001351 TaxID=3364564 RepID=UPI0036B02189